MDGDRLPPPVHHGQIAHPHPHPPPPHTHAHPHSHATHGAPPPGPHPLLPGLAGSTYLMHHLPHGQLDPRMGAMVSADSHASQVPDATALDEPLPSQIQQSPPPKKKRASKKRKSRDPQKPKPPRSGYVRFLTERRVGVQQQHPELPLPEITRIVASLWREASEEEKRTYNSAAEQEKEKYRAEVKAWELQQQLQQQQRQQQGQQDEAAGAQDRTDSPLSMGSHMDADSEKDKEKGSPASDAASVDGDLYCSLCHQYFSSHHNKREHLNGKKHREMLQEYGAVGVRMKIFSDEFVQHNRARERQLRDLKKECSRLETDKIELLADMEKLKERHEKLEHDIVETQNLVDTLSQDVHQFTNAFLAAVQTQNLDAPTRQTVERYLRSTQRALQDACASPDYIESWRNVMIHLAPSASMMRPLAIPLTRDQANASS
eukprot:m.61122 g.61122  ORF g.61122 m.61122 type:complete len:432 (+) comp11847_c0_seq3:426-1721(+)